MRILVASDKFKGSLTGREACEAIATGLARGLGDVAECGLLPVADGGEGMARAILDAKGGRWIEAAVSDPLGRPVTAGYALIDGGDTAVMEMAEASGLWRVAENQRDPWRASTFGTGELMRHAAGTGAKRILLGIGGSATNDGGAGMARALGWRFLDAEGLEIADLPARLDETVAIDASRAVSPPPLTVACDVANPLLGDDGCTRVYGPQKGVTPADLGAHEGRLRRLVSLLGGRGAAAADVPGAGAAGGLGFGCLCFAGGELRPGFDVVAGALDLPAAIAGADAVVTGEGRLDRQTLFGKAPAGVARLARSLGKPVFAFGGAVEPGATEALGEVFDGFAAIDRGALPLEASLERAAELLAATAAREARRFFGPEKPRPAGR